MLFDEFYFTWVELLFIRTFRWFFFCPFFWWILLRSLMFFSFWKNIWKKNSQTLTTVDLDAKLSPNFQHENTSENSRSEFKKNSNKRNIKANSLSYIASHNADCIAAAAMYVIRCDICIGNKSQFELIISVMFILNNALIDPNWHFSDIYIFSWRISDGAKLIISTSL